MRPTFTRSIGAIRGSLKSAKMWPIFLLTYSGVATPINHWLNFLACEQGGGFNWHSSISWQRDPFTAWNPFLQRQTPCPSGVGWHICWSLHCRWLQAWLHCSGSSSSLWGHSAWLLQTCPHVKQVELFRHWKPWSQLTLMSGIIVVRLQTSGASSNPFGQSTSPLQVHRFAIGKKNV